MDIGWTALRCAAAPAIEDSDGRGKSSRPVGASRKTAGKVFNSAKSATLKPVPGRDAEVFSRRRRIFDQGVEAPAPVEEAAEAKVAEADEKTNAYE